MLMLIVLLYCPVLFMVTFSYSVGLVVYELYSYEGREWGVAGRPALCMKERIRCALCLNVAIIIVMGLHLQSC